MFPRVRGRILHEAVNAVDCREKQGFDICIMFMPTALKYEGITIMFNNIINAQESRRLHQDAAEKVLAHQSALNSDDSPVSAIVKTKEEMEKAVNAYNSHITKQVHEMFLAQEAPLRGALTTGFYPKVSVKKKVKDDISELNLERDMAGFIVDIATMTKKNAKDVVNALWTGTVSQLAEMLRLAGLKALTDDADAFALAASKVRTRQNKQDADVIGTVETLWDKADVSKDADVFSVGTLQKAMQAIVDMIIADAPKVAKKDVRYVIMLMAREGKKNKISFANDDTVIRLLTKVLYTKLNDLDYEEDTK